MIGLRNIIEKGVAEGKTVEALTGEIKNYFKTFTDKDGWRVKRIARTEASNAWDQVALKGYGELGVKTIDVVGCEDNFTDCNAKGVPIEKADELVFHPNHTGTIVPADI